MTGPVDTSAREVARRLRSVPLDMTVDEFDAAGALIETLLAERDDATQRWLDACAEGGKRIAALEVDLAALRLTHASLQKAVPAQLAAARRAVWEEAARVCDAEQERCERAASRESVRAPYDPYPYAEQGEKAEELAAALRARADKENGDV